jgi:hypothetical protein
MAHDLSTWEEIIHEFRDHQYFSIQLIIRKATERIEEIESENLRLTGELSDTPFDNIDDLIAGYNESVEANKIFHDRLKIDTDLTPAAIEEQLDAYVSAYTDLKELDVVLVENLPFLTPGSPVEQIQHEFDRQAALHADVVRERDFYRMLAGANP